jgi:hypothetical protein
METANELQQLRQTVEDLRTEMALLRDLVGGTPAAPALSEGSSALVVRAEIPAGNNANAGSSELGNRTSRRNLLRLIGASATGAVVGTLASPGSAAAADGEAVLIGRSNSGNGTTTVLGNSALTVNGPTQTLGGQGVEGFCDGSRGYGVWGRSGTGYGMVGESSSGIDLATRGTGRVHLGEHIFANTEYLQGEIARDSSGSFWACVTGGTPGVWRKIASRDSAGATHFLANPVRLIVRTFAGRADAQVAGSSAGGQTIPAAATGVFGAVFGQSAAASAWVTLFPSDGAANSGVLASTATFSSAGFGGSSFSAKLSASGSLGMYTSSSSQILVDVAGYYL